MWMDNDTKARNRLLAYTAVRLGGLAIFFMGIAIMYTNWLRPSGWPQVGAIIAILGVLDSVLAPRLLKKAWDRQDEQERQ
jgi:membrane protein implicated in regulation of membrane protease activity